MEALKRKKAIPHIPWYYQVELPQGGGKRGRSSHYEKQLQEAAADAQKAEEAAKPAGGGEAEKGAK